MKSKKTLSRWEIKFLEKKMIDCDISHVIAKFWDFEYILITRSLMLLLMTKNLKKNLSDENQLMVSIVRMCIQRCLFNVKYAHSIYYDLIVSFWDTLRKVLEWWKVLSSRSLLRIGLLRTGIDHIVRGQNIFTIIMFIALSKNIRQKSCIMITKFSQNERNS